MDERKLCVGYSNQATENSFFCGLIAFYELILSLMMALGCHHSACAVNTPSHQVDNIATSLI